MFIQKSPKEVLECNTEVVMETQQLSDFVEYNYYRKLYGVTLAFRELSMVTCDVLKPIVM